MQSIDSMHLFVHHDSPPPLWSRKPLLMSDGYLQPWANERDKGCALVGQRWRMFVGTKPFESHRSRSRWERVIRILITTIDRNSIKFSDVQVGSVGHCVLPSSSRSKRSSCLRTAPAARASAPKKHRSTTHATSAAHFRCRPAGFERASCRAIHLDAHAPGRLRARGATTRPVFGGSAYRRTTAEVVGMTFPI